MKFAQVMALVCSMVAACACAGARETNTPTLYQQAVHILGGNGNVVSRWHEPIRFVAVGFDTRDEVARAIGEAADIATLEVSFPVAVPPSPKQFAAMLRDTPPYALWPPCDANDALTCVNFVALRTSVATMREIAAALPLPDVHAKALASDGALPCFFYPFRDGRLRIRQALVFINEQLGPAMRSTCINEEIFQAFGMFGDYTDSRDFSFNNVVAPKSLTQNDRLLLAALYDDKVKAGYPVPHVASIFIERVKRENAMRSSTR